LEDSFLHLACPGKSVLLCLLAVSCSVLVHFGWLVLTEASIERKFFATAGDSAALTVEAASPEYSRLCRVGVLSSRRQAHFLPEYCTMVFLMPNVRVNRPAEAGTVSPD
jgi:hypothetical protein